MEILCITTLPHLTTCLLFCVSVSTSYDGSHEAGNCLLPLASTLVSNERRLDDDADITYTEHGTAAKGLQGEPTGSVHHETTPVAEHEGRPSLQESL